MAGFLLDTHTLLWFDSASYRLNAPVRQALETTRDPVFVSAINLWEMGIKYRMGKLPEAEDLVTHWLERVVQLRLTDLPFTSLHAREAALQEWAHKDPFDRALAAQAQSERLTLVTRDPVFATLPGLITLW